MHNEHSDTELTQEVQLASLHLLHESLLNW